jgi:hypothetical protein
MSSDKVGEGFISPPKDSGLEWFGVSEWTSRIAKRDCVD